MADKEKLLKQIQRHFEESRDQFLNWREEAREFYRLYSNRQWSDEDRRILEKQQRPPITFNRIRTLINGAVGWQAASRYQTVFVPLKEGAIGPNIVLTAADRNARKKCNASRHETEAVRDLMICGLGWTETRISLEQNLNGEIVITRTDPFELYPDPSARAPNLSDGRFVIRRKPLSREEFKRQYPKAEVPNGNGWLEEDAESGNAKKPSSRQTDWYSDDGTESATRYIFVGEYCYYVEKNVYRYPDLAPLRDLLMQVAQQAATEGLELETSDLQIVFEEFIASDPELVEHSDADFKTDEEFLDSNDIPYTRQKKRQYRHAFFTSNEILSDTVAPSQKGFKYQCMSGPLDSNGMEQIGFDGVVKYIADPQRWTNKLYSQMLHIINSNAKGSILYETGAFRNKHKAMEDWGKPNAMVEVNEGGLAKITERGAPQLPQGLETLLQFAWRSFNDTSGIPAEMVGVVPREQSGSVETLRQEAGAMGLADFFDGVSAYRFSQGRLMLDLIRQYLTDNRLIRITDAEGKEEFVRLAKQDDADEYEVEVSQAPDSSNAQQAFWSMLKEALPFIKDVAPLPPETVKYLPLPDQFRMEWMKFLKLEGQPDEKQVAKQEAMEALQMETMQAQIAKLRADALAKEASAMLDQVKAQVESQQMSAEEAMKMIDFQIKLKQGELQQQNLSIQEKSANLDFVSKMQRAQIDMMKLRKDSNASNTRSE